MKKTILLVIGLYLCAITVCHAEAINWKEENGFRWNELSAKKKLGYVRGFILANDYCCMRASAMQGTQSRSQNEAVITQLKNLQRLAIGPLVLGNVDSTDITKRLDAFYFTKANQEIPICEAIQVATYYARGGDAGALKDYIPLLRIPPANRDRSFGEKWMKLVQRDGRFVIPFPVHSSQMAAGDKQ